jgi:hypothetical protein
MKETIEKLRNSVELSIKSKVNKRLRTCKKFDFKIVLFRMSEEYDLRTLKFAGFGKLEEIMGFTEEGIISDAFMGCLGLVPYKDICLEDLIAINEMLSGLKEEDWE